MRLVVTVTHAQICKLLDERARRYIALRRHGNAPMAAITAVVKGSYGLPRANTVARIMNRFHSIKTQNNINFATERALFLAMMGCCQIADREGLPWTQDQFIDALQEILADHDGYFRRPLGRDTESIREIADNMIYDARSSAAYWRLVGKIAGVSGLTENHMNQISVKNLASRLFSRWTTRG